MSDFRTPHPGDSQNPVQRHGGDAHPTGSAPHSGRPPVRRRRKRRPKWQRVLRHYWPLIRLILVFLLAVVFLVVIIKAIIGGIKKASAPKEDTTSQTDDTQQAETQEDPRLSDEAVSALLADTDFIAAGYDYQGAITKLQDAAAQGFQKK